MRDPRLGDDIDDFCVRCKRVMNHAVVSVINNEPAKVRCRTCHSDHDFRHEQPPPPKVDLRKAALFTEVLKKVDPSAAAAGDEIDPELAVDAIELDIEPEGDTEAVAEPDAEPVAAEEAVETEAAPPAEPAAKPKAKAKAKTTRKK